MAAIHPENIPAELRSGNMFRWAMWRRGTRDGKPAKIPCGVDGGPVKSNCWATWTTFEIVLTAFQDIGKFDGICWMMSTEPEDIVFIDIDHCIKDGIIEPWALEIIEQFNSYTERSQSGNGLHILIKGQKPGRRCRKTGRPFEMYDSLQACYLTGDILDGHSVIEPRQDALNRLYFEIFPQQEERRQKQARPTAGTYPEINDDTLILKAKLSGDGTKFKDLWDGVTLGYINPETGKPDVSAADFALMGKLAFWTGGNPSQMERLFSKSGLGKRDKWADRQDYRDRTIQRAIARTKEFYTPPKDSGSGRGEETKGPNVVDAIKALAGVCDGAATKDGCGFSKFDREEHDDLIKKATSKSKGYLSPKEEKAAYRFLKKYKKQLKELGVAYDDIGHIARGSSAAREDAGLNDSGQREIIVTNRHMQDITAESLPELVAYNNPPRIFVKAGYLVQIAVDEKEITRIEILSESVLKSRLSRSARYLSAGMEGELTPTDAPGKVVKDILALPNWPGILPIVGLISSPVVRPDGSVIYQPGHDGVTGLFYTGNVGMALTVPDRPTQDEAVTAAAYIVTEVFGDFPFREQASRANTLAALLTTLTLPLIGGNIPLGLFDKPQAGTGASLLTEIIAELVTGEKANMQTAPDNDEEWRKAITAVLMQGPQIVVIDNVTAALKSSKLSQMLTARTWSDRLLGQTKMLNLPQTAAWFATGNNIQLGGDIARRSYWIRLDAASARPWLRDGFRHHDILEWVEEHRSELLSMLLTMIRAWIVAGKPKGTAPKIGSFVKWSQVIGGILTYAGVEGFLGNAADLYDSADQDIAQWDLFLDEWQKLHRNDKITSGMLKIELTDIQPVYKPFQSEMPEEIIKATDKGTRGAVGLGKALSRHADQVFPSGRKLTVEVDSHTKGKKWSVTTIKRSAVDEKGPEPQASGPFAVDAVVGLTPSPNQKENISGIGQGEENIEIITERKENRAGPTTASTANAYSGGPGHFTSTAKEDPALAKFKAQVQSRNRNICRLCEQHFEIPLVIAYHGGGYICERCRRDGAPAAPPKAGSQVRVGEVKA